MIKNNSVETTQQNKFIEFASKIPVITQLNNLVEKIRSWKFAIWARQYNYSQWCYFVAGVLVVWNFFFALEESYILAGWVAFIGLVRELLHLFQHIWDNLIGKTAILILYASTANIAIAYAAMQINDITGIEPTPFVFALGFTTLVLLPIWVTLSTIVVFSFFLVAVNLWLLLRLPLKIIGFNLQLHWEDKKNAVVTMLLRIFLVPFAVTSVLTFTYPYFADFVDEPLGIGAQHLAGSIKSNIAEQKNVENANNLDDDVKDEFVAKNESPAIQNEQKGETKTSSTITETLKPNDLEEDLTFNLNLIENNDGLEGGNTISKKPVRQLIAHFIWYLEAYPKSRCIKPENSRTVPIDEIAVLIISQNKTAELGYNYEVTECELRN